MTLSSINFLKLNYAHLEMCVVKSLVLQCDYLSLSFAVAFLCVLKFSDEIFMFLRLFAKMMTTCVCAFVYVLWRFRLLTWRERWGKRNWNLLRVERDEGGGVVMAHKWKLLHGKLIKILHTAYVEQKEDIVGGLQVRLARVSSGTFFFQHKRRLLNFPPTDPSSCCVLCAVKKMANR